MNRLNIAYLIFSTMGVGKPLNIYEKIVVKVFTYKCKSRQDVLNLVIKLSAGVDTPKQRYIVAMAYSWSNKEYRDKAIYFLNLYLNNGLYNIKTEEQRLLHLSQIYRELATKYEQTYQFENALKCYKLSNDYHTKYCNEYNNNFEILRINEANILVKMNNIDEAIKLLNNNKKKLRDKSNLTLIDEKIQELNNKKNKGYIYKPKKK